MFQGITHNFKVDKLFKEWFGRFTELEKADIWKGLSEGEKNWARQQEENRIKGIVSPPDVTLRAFDDFTDETNFGFISQQLREISKPRAPLSDRSMSSGSGNYEEDAAKDNLSDDSDLALLKVLTTERAAKKQI